MAIITNADGSNPLVGTPDADFLDSTFALALTTLIGGAGDDTYHIDSDDIVIEQSGSGSDTVRIATTHALAPFVENLLLLDIGNADGTGNILANRLTGNAGSNTLDGGAGADILSGGAGADTLDGGAGIDTMTGGTGNDTYVVDNPGDIVFELNGASQGNADKVISRTHFHQLANNVENLELTGSFASVAYGNSLDNVMTGSGGNNLMRGYGGNDILDGGAGADDLQGGAGDDTYFLDNAADRIRELAGEGTDAVFTSVSYDFSATFHVENITALEWEPMDLTGNNLANVITGNGNPNAIYGRGGADLIDAGGGNDTLAGGSGADRLMGRQGDDVLDGGTGTDRLTGGTGNDTYYVEAAGDVITELPGEGFDQVFLQFVPATGTYLLGSPLEALDLSLVQGIAMNANGNALDNRLVGNDAANRLNGGTGNDFLRGGGGDDTLIGGTGNDTYFVGSRSATDFTRDATIVEAAGQGVDSVRTTVDFDMSDPATGAAHVENLYLDDPGYRQGNYHYVEPDWDIHAKGNAIGNRIFGNLGNNIVEGAGGNDVFYFYSYDLSPTWDEYGGPLGYPGATLDGDDFVFGGTQSTDAGRDSLFASVIDFSGSLHIHGVEEVTLHSGRLENPHDANVVDASDIVGADRITVAHMRLEDFVIGDDGVPYDLATADMVLTNIAAGTAIRAQGFAGADLTLEGAGAGLEELTVALDGFGPGRSGGRLVLENIETLNLSNEAFGYTNQVSIVSSDLQHVVVTGSNADVFLDLLETSAELTLSDTNLLSVIVSGTGPGPFGVRLDDAAATLVLQPVSRLDLDTTGVAGASNLHVVHGNPTPVTVVGHQDLTLTFFTESLAQSVDAHAFSGNLAAGTADYLASFIVEGGLGNDILRGGMASDRLNAGSAGNDFLYGNDGADTFVFDAGSGLGAAGHEVTLVDFTTGTDRIELDNAVFTALSVGTLGAADFYEGNLNGLNGQHIAVSGGSVYYSSDGTADTAQFFATIPGGLNNVQHADFVVV